jgi:aminopeptidase YwaD
MREAVHCIAQEIGERLGGSDAEHRTAEYMARRFRALGLQTDVQRFGFIGWRIDQWPSLEILSPDQISIEAAPLLYSASTPPEGVTGTLIHRGRTSLVPGVMDMPIYDVVLDDGERVASLVAELNGPAIPLLNPRPMLQIPQVVIGLDDSIRLDALLAKGPVRARLNLRACVVPEATAYNVICHARNPEAQRRLIISAHMDTTLNTPGAYDNASGLGALIELAQMVQDIDTSDGVDLIAFACEEIGFLGSAYYVNDLLERGLLHGIRACINLDMISGGDELWVWAGPDDFREKLARILSRTEIAAQYPLRVGPQRAGGDDWNFHIHGIPGTTMLLWRQDVYHKPTDTVDKVDWQRIHGMVSATLAIIREL